MTEWMLMTTQEIHDWNLALVCVSHKEPRPAEEERRFYRGWFRSLLRVWMRRIGKESSTEQ